MNFNYLAAFLMLVAALVLYVLITGHTDAVLAALKGDKYAPPKSIRKGRRKHG